MAGSKPILRNVPSERPQMSGSMSASPEIVNPDQSERETLASQLSVVVVEEFGS
jgi:hypothetical protein